MRAPNLAGAAGGRRAAGVLHSATPTTWSLRVTGRDGKAVELPVRPTRSAGGFVVGHVGFGGGLRLGDSRAGVAARLLGIRRVHRTRAFSCATRAPQTWALASGDEAALIVGREDTVHLRADSVSCVERIMLKDPAGKEMKTEWKAVKPDEVELKLPLQDAQPGAMTLW